MICMCSLISAIFSSFMVCSYKPLKGSEFRSSDVAKSLSPAMTRKNREGGKPGDRTGLYLAFTGWFEIGTSAVAFGKRRFNARRSRAED